VLPDADLVKEAVSKGVRVDSRWSRETLIQEILKAETPPSPPPAPPAAK
jgi:hypothetical protein